MSTGANAATGVCTSVVSLTRNEYEAVRTDGLRFIIAIDHENPELDLLVAAHERYSLVVKLPGEPARIALDSDPRKN
jgi:hypothetical protein